MNAESVVINLFNMSQKFDVPEMEFGATDTPGERKLWIAVIMAAINEYQDALARVSATWNAMRAPIPANLVWTLQHIRSECRHKWFQHICEMADTSPHFIIRKFDMLDQEYCLKAIPVADAPVQFESEWQRRKLRKRKALS